MIVTVRVPRANLSNALDALEGCHVRKVSVDFKPPASGPEVELVALGPEEEDARRALEAMGVPVLAIRSKFER